MRQRKHPSFLLTLLTLAACLTVTVHCDGNENKRSTRGDVFNFIATTNILTDRSPFWRNLTMEEVLDTFSQISDVCGYTDVCGFNATQDATTSQAHAATKRVGDVCGFENKPSPLYYCPNGNGYLAESEITGLCGIDNETMSCCTASMLADIQNLIDTLLYGADGSGGRCTDFPDDCAANLEKLLCWVCAPYGEVEAENEKGKPHSYWQDETQQMCPTTLGTLQSSCGIVATENGVMCDPPLPGPNAKLEKLMPWDVLEGAAVDEESSGRYEDVVDYRPCYNAATELCASLALSLSVLIGLISVL